MTVRFSDLVPGAKFWWVGQDPGVAGYAFEHKIGFDFICQIWSPPALLRVPDFHLGHPVELIDDLFWWSPGSDPATKRLRPVDMLRGPQ